MTSLRSPVKRAPRQAQMHVGRRTILQAATSRPSLEQPHAEILAKLYCWTCSWLIVMRGRDRAMLPHTATSVDVPSSVGLAHHLEQPKRVLDTLPVR